MIRHIAIFTWNDSATPERIAALQDQLAQLPEKIPALAAYAFGPGLGLAEGGGDFAVVAETADEDDWRAYVDHPAHVAAVAEFIRPLVATRSVIQI